MGALELLILAGAAAIIVAMLALLWARGVRRARARGGGETERRVMPDAPV